MPSLQLSAYTALSPDARPEDARELYARLRDLPEIGAITAVELGLDADGSVPDAEAVLATLPAHWDVVLTTVPGTMERLPRDAHFGLATDDPRGADGAREHLDRCLQSAARVDDLLGRAAVRGVTVLSGPPLRGPGRADAVDRMADRVAAAWVAAPPGVQPLLEHCDALVDGQTPAKGFLDLEDDIRVVEALRAAGRPGAGLVVNWGRSALETRSVDGPVEHLTRARAAGVLAGLVLSGCTAADGAFGPAWADTHAPLAELPAPAGEPTSLLTEPEVRRSLGAAGPVPVVGIKIGLRPHDLQPAARAQAIAAVVRRVTVLVAASADERGHGAA